MRSKAFIFALAATCFTLINAPRVSAENIDWAIDNAVNAKVVEVVQTQVQCENGVCRLVQVGSSSSVQSSYQSTTSYTEQRVRGPIRRFFSRFRGGCR